MLNWATMEDLITFLIFLGCSLLVLQLWDLWRGSR